ncbi:MAG: hemerythrin domain-containing protein [Caulobacteraceae bacterium]
MATRSKTRAQRSAVRKQGAGKDAISVLKADHREVLGWFEEYEDLTRDAEKEALSGQICLALKVHTQIEEEIFYPAVRKATRDDALMDESEVEHAGAKDLVAQIESMRVGEKLYDAKVRVLGEQIRHHAHEEETEMFPEARESDLDLDGLGRRLTARKQELMSQLSAQGGGRRREAAPGASGERTSPR